MGRGGEVGGGGEEREGGRGQGTRTGEDREEVVRGVTRTRVECGEGGVQAHTQCMTACST